MQIYANLIKIYYKKIFFLIKNHFNLPNFN
jgi:hypothetical protein